MNMEKLDSGNYRIRKMYKGVRYSLTFDHKPNQKEIAMAMADKLKDPVKCERGTMEYFANKRIDELEKKGKSPATLRGYDSIVSNTPEWFSKTQLMYVDADTMQKVTDEYSETRSPKTTRNFYSFYRSILADSRKDMAHLSINLPPTEKKAEYEPSTKDVMAIIDAVKDTRYSAFLQLSILGLRRGEIAAINPKKDLSEDNILTINKDVVIGRKNKRVVKDTAKTAASNRRILIPKDLADQIRDMDCVYDGNMHSINEYLHRVQDKLGIPRFRLHLLRHFAAAYLVKNGFTKNQILEYCGWEKGSSVMEKVYSYNLDPEESQKDISDSFKNLF